MSVCFEAPIVLSFSLNHMNLEIFVSLSRIKSCMCVALSADFGRNMYYGSHMNLLFWQLY